jgi:hypothetical protein
MVSTPIQTTRLVPWARSLTALKFAVAMMLPEGGALAQERKDFAQTPTPKAVARRMLEIGGAGPGETVVDLGSGDGRIPILAAQAFGAHGIGIELDRELHRKAVINAEAAAVTERVTFHNGDLFEFDFSQATVVTAYLLPSLMLRLRPRILEQMNPGARIVSHEFGMGAWRPDRTEVFEGRTLHFWVLPARAAGHWQISTPHADFVLRIAQTFQEITGSVEAAGMALPLLDASLWGGEIGFSVALPGLGLRRFRGRVDGDKMTALPIDEDAISPPEIVQRWQAVR